MKKLLGIVVLGLLICNTVFAKTIVKLPKDAASGYKKLYKSLTGKYYKDHGMQIVNKKDGYPVRAGEQSIRFEVRSGDCGKDKQGDWNDCKNDRERHELSGMDDAMKKGEYWFSWSIYFPKNHQNLSPLSNAYGQFHQKNGHPVFMFKELRNGYTIVRSIKEDYSDYNETKLLGNEEALGNWFDILINVKWTKKNDGFFKLWINDELKYDYKGPTKTKQYVYQKFGVYRTGITRYLNYKNLEAIQECFNEKGNTVKELEAFYKLQKRKYPGHKTSIKIYDKCKDYYNSNEVPTTIVYFDEVRKSKKREEVGIIK